MKVVYVSDERSKVVVAEPEIMQRIQPLTSAEGKGEYRVEQPKLLFENPKEQEAAKATLDVIRREFERLPRSADLTKPEIQKQIVEKVKEAITPAQRELTGIAEQVNVAEVVAKTITLRNELSIDIPRITVQPVGDVTRGYRELNLHPRRRPPSAGG